MEIKKQTHLSGELTVPGDKSISHRAVMFGSLAQGTQRSHIFWREQTVSSYNLLFPENGN